MVTKQIKKLAIWILGAFFGMYFVLWLSAYMPMGGEAYEIYIEFALFILIIMSVLVIKGE